MKTKTQTPEEFYEKFSPRLTYSVDRETLKYLLMATEGWVTYAGKIWDIKSKHLGVGVYRVYAEPRV